MHYKWDILLAMSILIVIEMGDVASMCGGNDMFSQLQQKYGADLGKFFAAEKGKQTVTEKFTGLTAQTNDIFSGFETKTTSLVGQYSSQLQAGFSDVQAKVNSLPGGGVPALQKMRGQSFADMTGFSAITSQVTQLQNDTMAKIAAQKATALAELGSQKTSIISSIDVEKPAMPLYDSLPAPVQASVFAKGEDVFKEQIAANQSAITSKLSSAVDLTKYTSMFNSLSPESALQNLTGGLSDKLLGAVGLGGGGIAGIGGNMMSNVKSFF